jgi:hypothetical protein
VLLLELVRRVAATFAIAVLSLWIFPIGLFAWSFIGWLRQTSAGRESSTFLWLFVAAAIFAVIALGARPYAAGVFEAYDRQPLPSRRLRAVRFAARTVQWAGGRVRTRARDLGGLGLWLVALVFFAPAALIVAGLIYLLQALLTDPRAFDQFRPSGLDLTQIALGTALGLFAIYEVLSWLHVRWHSARSAIWVTLGEVVGVLAAAVVAAMVESTHFHAGPADAAVLTGVAFGGSIAALLALAQATVAGVVGCWTIGLPS